MTMRAITTPSWTAPRLSNVTTNPLNPLMLTRAATSNAVYAINTILADGKIYRSVNQGSSFASHYTTGLSGTLKGLWILPDNSALLSIQVGGSVNGSLYRSTNFEASPSAFTQATVSGIALKMSRSDNYIHESWGLDYAPVGPYAGLVVATEYGAQSAGGDATSLFPKVWLSLDYGQTFTVIANLYDILGTKVNQHSHGVCFDPINNCILWSYGDANGSGGKSGILACYNYSSGTPTWTHVWGPTTGGPTVGGGAWFQVTTMKSSPAGIICASDGPPCGISLIPRTPGSYGTMVNMLQMGGSTTTYAVGQRIHQQTPTDPYIISWVRSDGYTANAVIHAVSPDGKKYWTMWEDSASSPGVNPATSMVGPVSGKYVADLSNDGRVSSPSRTELVGTL